MHAPAEQHGPKLVAVPPGRVPPSSVDAERSVLGGILLDNKSLDDLLEMLKPQDFYREAHRKTYEAMAALHEKREPVDRVTVKTALREQGALEAVGGEQFIDLLDTVVPSASNLLYYGTIVRETAIARRIIEAAHAIAAWGYEQSTSVGELIDAAETKMLAACEARSAGEGPQPVRGMIPAFFSEVEDRCARGTAITGLPSGFEDLDTMTAGFQPSEFIVLAARPSVGKSAFAFEVAGHTALRKKLAAVIFSLEMPRNQVLARLFSQFGNIEAERIKKGTMRPADFDRAAKIAGELAEAPLEIDDQAGLTVLELRARARRLRAKYSGTPTPLGLVVVDYLQLMGGEGQNQDDRLTKISGGLKNLAKELAVPLIALSQLNRESERNNRRPVLSDLRGSGSLEQDGDVVMFLHKPKGDDELVESIIQKQRNGPTGVVELAWRAPYTRFENTRREDGTQRQREFFENVPPPSDDDRRGD